MEYSLKLNKYMMLVLIKYGCSPEINCLDVITTFSKTSIKLAVISCFHVFSNIAGFVGPCLNGRTLFLSVVMASNFRVQIRHREGNS